MLFIRTQRSGVHFGGHRRWPEKPTGYPRMRINTLVIPGKIR